MTRVCILNNNTSTAYLIKCPGFCKRGDACWFIHATDSKEVSTEEEDEELCSICFEKPATYGLLSTRFLLLISSLSNFKYSQADVVTSSAYLYDYALPFSASYLTLSMTSVSNSGAMYGTGPVE